MPGFLASSFTKTSVLALSLMSCVLLAWLANFGLKALFPRPGRRLLTLFVAIQAFLLLTNAIMLAGSTDLFPDELWNLDLEWTVPSVHSTIQLLLLASLCYLNGPGARRTRRGERAWWLALGLAVTGLAMLEFFEFFRYMIPETLVLRASGASLLLTSLLMLWRQRRDPLRRNGLLLLLGGMGLWAFGVFRLDYPISPKTFKAFEETVETLGIAIAIAGVTNYAQASWSNLRFPRRRYLACLCLTNVTLALMLVVAFFQAHRVNPQDRFLLYVYGNQISADTADGALALRAWSVDDVRPGKSTKIRLWLYAARPISMDFGYSVQLLDQASLDTTLTFNKRSGIDSNTWLPGTLFIRELAARFHVPEDVPVNRAQWLTLSFWKINGDEFLPLKINSSDYPLLGDTHVILDELVLPALTLPAPQGEPLASFANGFALHRADLPAEAIAGREMTVDFQWRSDSAGQQDWTQFLHFTHGETGEFWTVDRYPLGPRLPTRLWYAGMQSRERWSFPVPEDTGPGDYRVYTGLYRLADMKRLGATDRNGAPAPDGSIALGSVTIRD